MTSAASIEDTFRPAFEEIRRRSEAVGGRSYDPNEISYFEETPDATRLPFVLPDQDYVLVTMGTAVLAPCPVDKACPAMRVYGAFATPEEAKEHAAVVSEIDGGRYSLMIVKRDEWTLMAQTVESRDDPTENRRRRDLRLQAYRARQSEDGDAFLKAVRDGIERPAPQVAPPEDEERREEAEAEALVYQPPRRLRAGAEVRGQSAVALCVAPDEVGGECLVKVLGCFETTSEAENWVRNVATRHVTDDDIVVTGTCDWFYPNGRQKASREYYRNKELQRILDAAERNPKQVRRYKEWKLEQDRLEEASQSLDVAPMEE